MPNTQLEVDNQLGLLSDEEDEEDAEGEAEKSGLEALVAGSEEKFSDVIEMAAKFQPTGNTLVSRLHYLIV